MTIHKGARLTPVQRRGIFDKYFVSILIKA